GYQAAGAGASRCPNGNGASKTSATATGGAEAGAVTRVTRGTRRTTRRRAYRGLLRDPRWQRRRLEIFARDGWRCQHCGATHRELQVHHLAYLPAAANVAPWDYPARLLVTLCHVCHSAVSKGGRRR